MSGKPKVFVREATGLVRTISQMDHLVTNMNGVVPLAAIAMTPFWIFVAIPGGDPIIAIVIAALFSIFGTCSSYAMTAATFPRSGSPYVTQSRVLAPWIGWPSEALMWFGWIVALALYPSGFFIYLALVPSLYAMGISSGNAGLIATASWLMADPTATILLGTVFLLFCLGIAIAGTKVLVRSFQLPITVIMFIAIFVMIGAFAAKSPEQFAALMPKYLGNTREGIIAAGKDLPSMVPISGAFYPLMAAAGFTAGSANTYWNAYAVGEVKHANNAKMQVIAMTVPSMVITVLCVIIYSQLYSLAGRDFLIALINFSSIGSQVIKAPLSWGGVAIPYIALMAVDNYWLQLIILLGLISATLAYVPATWLVITRDMFAWSFDRLLPAKFSEVSDRFHTPVWNIFFNFILAEILLMIFTYYAQYLSAAFVIGWDTTLIAVTILCVAAAVLPLRKHLWENSPVKNWKVAGIPIITIVGIIGAYYNGFAVWVYTVTPAVGFGNITDLGIPRATWLMILIAAVPFVFYWIIRAYRKRQGIDIDLIFREVPPE
jgi:basic amino acid/polyamine antiporter, APA family